ncbi:MAG: heme A synthase [Acidiferrobacteraceae bacterium]|nr:heme A synthase [Acidiferrobacteraceae bacterium]
MSTRPLRKDSARLVGLWLLVSAVLVFVMVVLGGVTRLTGSGLSMVDWEPISGVIPPISSAEWQAEFENYQMTPEYIRKNHGMALSEFKRIFYFEYAHRMLGRTIGLVILLQLIFFYFTRRIDNTSARKYILMLLLVGLQGLLGWYMVKSGLVDIPQVSQYRLTAHLGAAILIYSYILWSAFAMLVPARESRAKSQVVGLMVGVVIVILITLLSGGFVAGLKAGHAFNTFPLMSGEFLPPGYFTLAPWWRNLFENVLAVQFNHRYIGIITYLILWICAVRGWNDIALKPHRVALAFLVLIGTTQGALGLAALLLHVPIVIAVAHQAVALLLLTNALYLAYLSRSR